MVMKKGRPAHTVHVLVEPVEAARMAEVLARETGTLGVRGSTASVASESMQDVRLQTIAADEAVSRVMDRLLLRGRRHAPRPTSNGANGAQPEVPPDGDAIPAQRETATQAPQP